MEGGLDLEKQTSIPVEAELFFLTSLFIELIETEKGEESASLCESPVAVEKLFLAKFAKMKLRQDAI
jgi:hypothetical protein